MSTCDWLKNFQQRATSHGWSANDDATPAEEGGAVKRDRAAHEPAISWLEKFRSRAMARGWIVNDNVRGQSSHLTVLTLCSGIGAAEAATQALRYTKVVAACEIAPEPSAVLAARFPGTPNLHDMTAADFVQNALAARMPGIRAVFSSTPCQSFSVAGLRQGLADDRGKLTPMAAEIFNGLGASSFFWENVPGALSDKTNAFGCMLQLLLGGDEELPRPGKRWPKAGIAVGPKGILAWRVLDAQHYGLAQRRRRIFLAFCTHESGIDPSQVLFDFPDGAVMRYADVPKGTPSVSVCGVDIWTIDRKGRLPGNNAPHAGEDPLNGRRACDVREMLHNAQVPDRYHIGAQAALGTRNRSAVNGKPVEPMHAAALDECVAADAVRLLAKERKDRERALAKGKKPVHVIKEASEQRLSTLRRSLLSYLDPMDWTRALLDAKGEHDVLFARKTHDRYGRATVSPTLTARGGRAPQEMVVTMREGVFSPRTPLPVEVEGMDVDDLAALAEAEVRRAGRRFVLRRYTPLECLRLMGFAADHCMVPSSKRRRKLADKDAEQLVAFHAAEGRSYSREYLETLVSDAEQYKAAGNSIAVPCMLRILRAAEVAVMQASEAELVAA